MNKTEDFSKAEGNVIKLLQWNLQCVTLIDVVESYLVQGVVFGSDFYEETMADRALTEKKLNLPAHEENNASKHSNAKENSSENPVAGNTQLDDKKKVKFLSGDKVLVPVQRIEKEYQRLCNLIIRGAHLFFVLIENN